MSNANYLAHFGTKGQKHGLRRHQSYETAPTRSGMVGQEVGEAARQSERLNRRDEQDYRNGPRRGPMQYEAKPSYKSPSDLAKASNKQTLKEKLRAKKAEKDAKDIEKNKAKWATSYKDLEKHKDAFTNKELEYALNRLNLTDRIKSDRWEQTRNLTQKGADTMRNLANASKSFVDIYNVVAGGYNTYQNYKSNKAKKIDLMPKWNAGSGSYNVSNQNKSNNNNKGGNKPNFNGNKNLKKKFKHSGMSATEYIAHFGVPGQQWFKRHFQSYKTAPTRSGKVGEEIGLAAKQAERLGEEEKNDKDAQLKALQESNRKTLESAGFNDATPNWYDNYASTKNVKKYSIEMHDPANDGHSDGVNRTKALLEVDDNCYEPQIKAAVDFSKNFEKHDTAIKDAIVKSYFSSPNNVPWLYEKGYADELPLGKRFIEGKSFEEQKKFFRDHLGIRADTSKDKNAFSTGGKSIILERGGMSGEPDDCIASVYYSDGGAYFGHVFTAFIDLKTGKVHEVSMGG